MKKNYFIHSFARPSNTVLSLQLGAKTGKTRFIARNVKNGNIEIIDISCVATLEILEEIKAKSVWSSHYGWALNTTLVSGATKDFISGCWQDLKKLKPELCIK